MILKFPCSVGIFDNLCEQVKNWVRELRKMLGDNIELCIAGNKIDLEKDRKVDKATALQ